MPLDMRTKELIAVAASIAGNCFPCLEWHYKKCVELGISNEDIKESIEMALKVKEAPNKKILETANKLTQRSD